MKKWQQTMNDIKFDGKEDVMARIENDLKQKESLISKCQRILDFEIEVPIAPAIAFAVGVLMIWTIQFKPLEDRQYQYTITVVNQWGNYENY